MKDNIVLKEQIPLELLEGVAGGMTDSFEADFAEFLKTYKKAGFTKEKVKESFAGYTYSKSEYEKWDTSKEEMLAFIDKKWDSL